MNLRRSFRSTLALLGGLLSACGGVSDDGLYGPAGHLSVGGSSGTGGGGSTTCGDSTGTWATFVQVGVDWSSGTILPGSGTVKQWIISERFQEGNQLVDQARACGIGAKDVPLGSPWFGIKDLPAANIFNEWTGVEFMANLFDLGTLATVDIQTTVTRATSGVTSIGDVFDTAANPFAFGYEGLEGEWPGPSNDGSWTDMVPLAVDHDGDGHPGLTGTPFSGTVPGEGFEFRNPRLAADIDPNVYIPRASKLYMTLRTQAGLHGTVVSCDPMRVEGEVAESTLQIDIHIVACEVEGTGEPCTETHIGFIDPNLPSFEHNGTSLMVSYQVPDGTTCAEVREMEFERTRSQE